MFLDSSDAFVGDNGLETGIGGGSKPQKPKTSSATISEVSTSIARFVATDGHASVRNPKINQESHYA
ncbi:MAG TPA: hypothetical protein VFX06_06860 [Stellaceae bacterium]|nr:hypothetical protein [Stellaceae bacterium]